MADPKDQPERDRARKVYDDVAAARRQIEGRRKTSETVKKTMKEIKRLKEEGK